MADKIGSAEFEIRANTKKIKSDIQASEKDVRREAEKLGASFSAGASKGPAGFASSVRASMASIRQSAGFAEGGLRASGAAMTSSLGAVALGAAAVAVAFAAVKAAAGEAIGAMKMADEISDTANRLQITTDALQEFRYALRVTGGEAAQADGAIESFMKAYGSARSEFSERSIKPFEALGFTPTDLKHFANAEEALQAVVDKIAALSDESEQAAIAEKLGLSAMLPLIRAGTGEFAKLRAEAHSLGLVMDADLVKRGGEVNDQFETISQMIDVQLKSAFIDLAPAIQIVMGKVGELAAALADLADSWRDLESKSSRGLSRQIKRLDAEKLRTFQQFSAYQKRPDADPNVVKAYIISMANLDKQIGDLRYELNGRSAPVDRPARTGTLRPVRDGGALSAPASRAGNDSYAGKTVEVVAIDPEVADLLRQLEYWRSVEERGGLAVQVDQNPDGFKSAEDRAAELTRAIEDTRQAQRETFREAFTGGLMAALQGGEKGFAQWIQQGAERGLEKALNNLADLIFNLFSKSGSMGGGIAGQGGGILSSLGSIIGGIFGGPRAYGGPVTAGRAYRVGERGPETLIAPASGMIIPKGGFSASAGRQAAGGQVKVIVQSDDPKFRAFVASVAGPIAAAGDAQTLGTVARQQQSRDRAQAMRARR